MMFVAGVGEAEGGKKNRKPVGLDLDQCAKIRNPNPLEMLAGYSVVVWVGLLILLAH
jgi:hypothetical protein